VCSQLDAPRHTQSREGGRTAGADARFVSAFDNALRGFMTFMDSGPAPPILLGLILLTHPLLSLVHELGHAGAALALLPGRVAVTIGGQPPVVVRDLGRMTIALHPVMLPWRFHAACTYEAQGSRAETAVIALTGPAASLLTCIVMWSALVRVGPGLVHDVLFVMTLVSLVEAVGNLVPMTLTDSRGIRRRTDGATILAALRYRAIV
jgi:hypothetical protein